MRKPKMNKAVIFDLDGVIMDSETEHWIAFSAAMAEYGVTVTEEQYADYWIRGGGKIPSYLKEHGYDINPDDVYRKYRERFYGRLTVVKPMPGAADCLEYLHPHRLLAVATGSHKFTSGTMLESVNFTRFFEHVVTSDDVTNTKPHPEVFLLTAEKLGLSPEECVVVEDAQKGIIAARAAGMAVIGVPNRHTVSHDFSQASRVIKSLEELTLSLIDSLE
jgi:HAD superfamily hydrolase (TIGR01509 family)